MKNRIIENNQVCIIGEIVSEFQFSNEVLGEGFYLVYVQVKRISESCDRIPVIVSERLIDVSRDYRGKIIRVFGQFRSYNRREENRNRHILSVFAMEINFSNDETDNSKVNQILLDGYICKDPVYRKTPFGREISDIMISVNRSYGKSDYIPCICWGRNARYAAGLEVGSRIKICGRVQSREYKKSLSEEEYEMRTAYEVSIQKMEVVPNEQI